MQKELKFTIIYGKHTFEYQYGSQVYIFHAGIYNNVDKKYGLKGLREYVSFVHNCYLSDSNRTPLGALADYIATHWKKLKNKGRYDVLEEFYEKDGF